MTQWRPILDGTLAERARATIDDIVKALPDPSESGIANHSLAGGNAGLALLCGYLALTGYDDEENAAQFLEKAIHAVSTEQVGPTFYGGFAGIAWVAEHLQTQLQQLDEDANEEIDEVLEGFLKQSEWVDDYDLISGLVGYGVYALDRLPRPVAVKCLELIIEHLAQTAERNAEGITWRTSPELLPDHQRKDAPEGYYNVGLAHGVPGVIAFLGLACAAGIAVDKARPLLDGAVAWLLSQQLADADSAFPSWVVPGVESGNCRLAWCYGDAGLCAALLIAARSIGNPKWEEEAINIARRAALRPVKTVGAKDAGLCHGAAGIAHIFNRMFHATGDELFKDRAKFWFEQTLDMGRPGKGVGGYLAYHPDENGNEGWADDPGLLTGAAGIALALLAATTDVVPDWDRMLLVSIPQHS